jgi:predicted Zn-dependent protease
MIEATRQPDLPAPDPALIVDHLRRAQHPPLTHGELMDILSQINQPVTSPKAQAQQDALAAFCRRDLMVGDLFKNLGAAAQRQLIDLTAAALSPAEEAHIGAQLHTRIAANASLNPDPALTGYLNALLERIRPELRRQDLPWQVHVIDDPSQMNAISTAGGYIYFFTGLLDQVENEAQVVGVLAHEVAHHELGHTRTIYQYLKALGVWADDTLSDSAELDIMTLLTLPMRSHQEQEADAFAAELLFRLGYSPLETVALMAHMEQFDVEVEVQGSFGTFLLREAQHLLNTHPLSRLRACDLMREIDLRQGWGDKVGADNWAQRSPMP